MPGSPKRKAIYVQIRCDKCKLLLTETIRNWESPGLPLGFGPKRSIPCKDPGCRGRMREFGQKISNESTAARKRSVDTQLKMNGRKRRKGRGIRRPDREFSYEKPEDLSDEVLDDSDDFDFIAPIDFTPSMRYTTGRTTAARALTGVHPGKFDKTTGRVRIDNAISGERQKSTAACFGGKPAWQFAKSAGAHNAGNYSVISKNHYEWCHLQGVALGGKTLPGNLCAGHYALNTWMMTIEGVLQGKRGFEIEVTAYCEKKDIIDRLVYDIYTRNTLKLRLVADGRMRYFSRIDYESLIAVMRNAGIRRQTSG